MFAAHAVVAFQFGLCITPEVLDAVDVMTLACSECLLMVDAIVLEAVKHQSIVRAEAVRVDDALRNDFRPDDLAQRLSGNVTDYASVNAAVAPEQAKNGHFTGSAASATAFALAPEVALIALDFAAERTRSLAFFGKTSADDLVDALSGVAIDLHCFSGSTRRHFKSEVPDKLIELAVSQLTVFN